MNFQKLNYYLLLLTVLLLSACASTEIVKPKQRFVWPPPPADPKIEWLATYSNQLDFEKTSIRIFKETIVGEDAPISIKRPIEARYDTKNDKLYVADIDKSEVMIFDIKNRELRNIPFIDVDKRKKSLKPLSLTLDENQNLYILEAVSKNIYLFNADEKFIRSISIEDFTEMPVSIVYDAKKNRIFVIDVKKNNITAIDLSGNRLFTFGTSGEKPGEFNRPTGLAFTAKGEIVVADTFNARVQIFDDKGNFIYQFGKRGDGATDFQLIKGLAVDPDDNIYVTDTKTSSVKIFDKHGNPLLVFGGFYSVATTGKLAVGGFALPVGIDIDKFGTITVVDQMNSRVQMFRYLKESEVK